MKKHGIGSRLLALLLALAMVLPSLPLNAFAAVGDIAGKDDLFYNSNTDSYYRKDVRGDTGLTGNIDTTDTISWPIKIYDYLNDGMLFEYANAAYQGDIDDNRGGAYGGGTSMPLFYSESAGGVIGNDYTVADPYNKTAYYNWLSQNYSAKDSSAETVKTRVEAANFKDPMHLQISYPAHTSNRSKSYVWVSDFANDNEKYYSKEDIRYVVVVYRTNATYAETSDYRNSDSDTTNDGTWGVGSMHFAWAVSDAARSDDYTYHVTNANSSLKDSSGNRIIDISDLGDTYVSKGTMTGADVSLPASTDKWSYLVYDMYSGVAKENWDSIGSERIAGVRMTIPINDKGEEIDISHIAYFGTEFEATEFGKDAVAFDNDPGEYLNSHTEYYDSQEVAVTKPTTNNNGMDFSVADKSTGGYAIDTYQGWTTTVSGRSYVGGVGVTTVNNGERSYVQVSNKNNSSNKGIYLWSWSNGYSFSHVTIVYKTTDFTSDADISFFVVGGSAGGANLYSTGIAGVRDATKITLEKSEGDWTYVTYAFSQIDLGDSDYAAGTAYTEYGLYLPSCMTGEDMSLDIAMVQVFNSASDAQAYGERGAKYMNGETEIVSGSYTTGTKKWNTGNNVAFSMLYANQGGGWYWDDVGYYDDYGNFIYYKNGYDDRDIAGGENEEGNGYYSYQIGKSGWGGVNATVTNSDRETARDKGYTVSDEIWLLNSWQMADDTTGYYDMSELELGYTLFNQLYSGVMTAGLLEHTLTTVTDNNGGVYRVPDYKEETIEYIAYLLRDALSLAKTDASGNYNYNFVSGTANGDQYGYDANGNAYDLASALRAQLGVTLPAGGGKWTYSGMTYKMGDYATMTDEKKASLIGEYLEVKDNIETFVDAAYYLLMNLYVANSYNQAQDEYIYLIMAKGNLETNGKDAYIFDGGFTTGNYDDTANTDEYRASSNSAVSYDKERGTISLLNANTKDKVYFQGESTTTRFPFLPVTDATGVYAGETKSPYFHDDGNGVMGITKEGPTFVNRNYNYAMASNGEFVYHKEDGLFFDFEGDDDVYLFINGELVVDVGAAHSVTTVTMNVNDYVEWAKETMAPLKNYGYYAGLNDNAMEDVFAAYDAANATDLTAAQKEVYLRANRLNLVEGGNYKFDFYYMERHGWGANCRIATNIRVTDPAMQVEKHAYQNNERVAYGDVVVAEDPLEYNFYLYNNGNTKLFNLTFTDATIGVTLDPENGLTVAEGMNGYYVFDKDGGKLDAEDITAQITGYQYVGEGKGTYDKVSPGVYEESDTGEYLPNPVTLSFSGNEALKEFLHSLKGEGLKDAVTDSTVIQDGEGLWVDASITIKGIYYKLTYEQITKGVMDNTVYVTATSRKTSGEIGYETLQSQASHRVYVTGAPYYYQWADHELFVTEKQIYSDANKAAMEKKGQMTEYYNFFNALKKDANGNLVTNTNGNLIYVDSDGESHTVATMLCDKFGESTEYSYVASDNVDSTAGYKVNYPEHGTYVFYVMLYVSDNADKMTQSQYAIIRVTIYVADVEDSVYVLDYGLTTEDLNAGGILFAQDNLFGESGANVAKLMAFSTGEPSYLTAANNGLADGNQISFDSLPTVGGKLDGDGNGTADGEISRPDGSYMVDFLIASTGKKISYNATNSHYSLLEAGTVTIKAVVPATWSYGDVYLYYWYDDGANNSWPGQKMVFESGTTFSLEIPGDVSNIIIGNGTAQTGDLTVPAGVDSTITITEKKESVDGVETVTGYECTVTNSITSTTLHVKVPSGWGAVGVYTWDNNVSGSETATWPGNVIGSTATDGWYSITINDTFDRVIINNNNNGKQTVDMKITRGKEAWITLSGATVTDTTSSDFGEYTGAIAYSTNTVKVSAQVPEGWGTAYLYYWYSDGTPTGVTWPGNAMTHEGEWWVGSIPDGVSHVIITNSDGSKQTVNLDIPDGADATIKVSALKASDGKYLADVDNPTFTFKPKDFMDERNNIWLALTVHEVTDKPSALTGGIDISHEVQMYKKLTVLPASVVYYEDDFPAIKYTALEDGGTNATNTFTKLGSSDDKTQSVDQNENYGHDATYADSANSEKSGGSLTTIKITGHDRVANFTFNGTGFELISRTNAVDSASIEIYLFSGSVSSFAYDESTMSFTAADGTKATKVIPVITEFDHNADAEGDSNNEGICQVPVIRVDDLTYGTYTVVIAGVPGYDYSVTPEVLRDTYLYVDGLRIFQPMGSTNIPEYNENEEGAVFTELRDLIAKGNAVVVNYNGEAIDAGTGLNTWTENRNSVLSDGSVYEGNVVTSVNDYLLLGPNNEVYMESGESNTSAVVLYVTETGDGAHNLQIAVRALDKGLYYGTGSSGLNAELQYGVVENNELKWERLATVTSGTEQYYTIDYTKCPKDDGGRYQVVIRVANTGMISYTTVKTNGLTIENVGGPATTLRYGPNGLEEKASDGKWYGVPCEVEADDTMYVIRYNPNNSDSTYYVWEKQTESATWENYKRVKISDNTVEVWNGTAWVTPVKATPAPTANPGTYMSFRLLSRQMMATAVVGEDEVEPDVPETTEPEVTEPEVTEPEIAEPAIKPDVATLTLEDEICYNIYFTVENLDVSPEAMSLLAWDSEPADPSYDNAHHIYGGVEAVDGRYRVSTDGVPAKEMGDTKYFVICARLDDGSYLYSEGFGYSAKTYAMNRLEKSNDEDLKALCVALLNYGAEAQKYFGYRTDDLMNAGLTDAQKALAAEYDASMVASVVKADAAKVGDFAETGGFDRRSATVTLGGALALNYYLVPSVAAESMTLYYWDSAAYNAASVLTAENATEVISMISTESGFRGTVDQIAAKEIDQTVYVCGVYEVNGETYSTGIIAYSVGAYCVRKASGDNAEIQPLAKATAVYGCCAKTYFGK